MCQAAYTHPLRPFAPRQTLHLTYTCPKAAQNNARWHDRFFGAEMRIQQLFAPLFIDFLEPKNHHEPSSVIIIDHRNQNQILRTWRAHLSIPPRRQCICRISRSDSHQPRAQTKKLTQLVQCREKAAPCRRGAAPERACGVGSMFIVRKVSAGTRLKAGLKCARWPHLQIATM